MLFLFPGMRVRTETTPEVFERSYNSRIVLSRKASGTPRYACVKFSVPVKVLVQDLNTAYDIKSLGKKYHMFILEFLAFVILADIKY